MLKKFICLILSVFILSGCAHPLKIKNLNSYRTMSLNPLKDDVSIGIIPSTGDMASKNLVKGIGMSLQKNAATVYLPYFPKSKKPVDVVASISIQPKYKGSGMNFLINWPGFLLFVPALNGYIYKVNYNIDISLNNASDNSLIDSWSIPVKLDVRHAEFDRTWTEISWLEVSAIAFLGGLFFTQYDPDVTQLVVDKIEGPIGDYVAQEIIARINNCGILSEMQTQENGK